MVAKERQVIKMTDANAIKPTCDVSNGSSMLNKWPVVCEVVGLGLGLGHVTSRTGPQC
jgi:hypothetical protein